ncbi:hypothetical protein CBR_g57872 [Chara braunii]|uniref:Uncharacterized protein n=1 Tax=Chara braunii TaxID=69332 RepID=A0A388K878_CHABU|nr:hypothetical protein CBR_g57872 [Chara braunii]|eukprot:GBG66274.1 hypothetical protein CBR_g57872 [Chara braunii]
MVTCNDAGLTQKKCDEDEEQEENAIAVDQEDEVEEAEEEGEEGGEGEEGEEEEGRLIVVITGEGGREGGAYSPIKDRREEEEEEDSNGSGIFESHSDGDGVLLHVNTLNSGNAGMATDAMEKRTETKGDTTDAVVTDAMEEHTETKGDTTAAVATDAMEEHTETKGDTAGAGQVAPAESIVEATKADEEEAANRKGAARVTNGMEGVTKTYEDASAADTGNEEEAVIGVTCVVRGQCVDTRESE